ncbi:MAG: methyltransferase domain-containing protein [Candidatus Brocadiae bacterium]|nr:methyltransferase domain-containing protein [Candidatus Brocadiia bacterium]
MSSGMEFRRLVWEVLCDTSGKFRKDILREKFAKLNIPAFEKRFISEMVHGITRRKQTLEHIARQYSKALPKDIWVLNALWMGLYQMLFMQSVPAYAIIDTTVELLKERKKHKESGYVNAILRRVQRESHGVENQKQSDDILPIDLHRSIQFQTKVFPNPEKKLCEYWSIVYSYPLWIVNRWYERWGKEDCQRILEAGNSVAPVFLRVRKNFSEIEKAFTSQGIEFSVQGNFLQLLHPGRIEALPLYQEGYWTVIGPSAASFVEAMNPKPGMKILDMCAAPGSKSAYIADLLENSGTIIAVDISAERIQSLEENKIRLKIDCLQPVIMDASCLPKEYTESFDQVLLDAPCSNSAVLAKRGEARWRLNSQNIQELCHLQKKLLLSAARAVKKGGTLVYCTCSLEPEENQAVIQNFLEENQEFVCEEKKQIFPLPPELDGGSFFKLSRKNQEGA